MLERTKCNRARYARAQQSQKSSALALEHQTRQSNANVIKRIGRDRAYALSAREVRVTLAAIANLLCYEIPEWLRAIDHIPGDRAQCDRVQTMRSSAHDLAATLIFAYK